MPSFKVSGLYEGLFVMQDSLTGSHWLHYTGECILGELAGRSLTMLDTSALSFGAFRQLYGSGSGSGSGAGNGTVVEPTTSWWRKLAGKIETNLHFFALPGMFRRTLPKQIDPRLPESTLGLGVVLGRRNLVGGKAPDAARFYPLQAMKERGFVQEDLAGTPIVVVMDASLGAPVAYVAKDGERALKLAKRDDLLVDEATGRSWDLAGKPHGPEGDRGERLPLAAGIFGRWYGFVASYPKTTIFGLDE